MSDNVELTNEEIAAIKVRLSAVPKGPWTYDQPINFETDERCSWWSVENDDMAQICQVELESRSIAEFISHSCTDIERLVEYVEELEWTLNNIDATSFLGPPISMA